MVLKKTDLVLNEEISYILADLEDFWKNKGFNQYSKYLSEKYLNEKGYNSGEEEIYIFEKDDKIIGILSFLTYIYDVVEVKDYFILNEFDREKYLLMMIEDILSFCEYRKIRKLTIYSNADDYKIFEQKGFIKEGILKKHFTCKNDIYLMSIEL